MIVVERGCEFHLSGYRQCFPVKLRSPQVEVAWSLAAIRPYGSRQAEEDARASSTGQIVATPGLLQRRRCMRKAVRRGSSQWRSLITSAELRSVATTQGLDC